MSTDDLNYNRLAGIVISVVILIAIAGWAVSAVLFLQPKGVLTCASFGSYADIVDYTRAHPKSLQWLDRNHNGIPCESRRPFNQ